MAIGRSAGRSTPKCIMGYILWDVFGSHFGFKKRWEFLLFLNNYGSKQSVSIVQSCQMKPPWHPNTPKHPHMTITNFNYEGSYLPGVICNIVIKADLGRSPGRWTPHMKLSVVDNQLVHDLLEIYVFNKSPFETAQVYSSSVPVGLSIGASMC